MKTAFVFPGQGAQFVGMGRDLYDAYAPARALFEQANQSLGFPLTTYMFEGPVERLRETRITQPAVFVHSIVAFRCLPEAKAQHVAGVAGHSLGEFSALVAANALDYLDGLRLVSERAQAMQLACEQHPSTMAAVLGLSADKLEEICLSVNEQHPVVIANDNCPGQLVISGTLAGVEKASARLTQAGARRVLPLSVGGAFHSPLMASAQEQLAKAIAQTPFLPPRFPVYQNVDAAPSVQVEEIRTKLIAQLTAPVRWTALIERMLSDGITSFLEFGPGNVLEGLIKKIKTLS